MRFRRLLTMTLAALGFGAAFVSGGVSAQESDAASQFQETSLEQKESPEPGPAPGLLSEVPLADLRINGFTRGAIGFLLDAGGRPLIKTRILRAELADLVRPRIIEEIDSWDRFIAPDELESAGIIVSYDPGSLILDIEVQPKAMRIDELSLEKGDTSIPQASLYAPESFAAILGTSLRFEPSIVEGPSGSRIAARTTVELEPSVYLFGFVAQGSADFTYSNLFSSDFRAMRITRDFPGIGAKLVGGMIDPRVDSFQASSRLIGTTFYRDRSLPGGGGSPQPVIDELVLERKASVEIEVNGIIARRFVLQPGSYRLSELSLASGMNTIVIAIEEEGEEARRIELGEPFDSAILNHGELDYAISLGMDQASLSTPLGSAFVSAGIGRYAEVGFDAQFGFGSALGGLSTLLATPLGNIGGAAALSLNYEDPADLRTAFGARLSWRLSLAGATLAPKLGAGIEYRGAGFSSPLETKPESFRESGGIWQISGQVGQTIPGWGANLAAFGNAKIQDGALSRWGLTAGLTLPLPGSIIASFSGGSDWTPSEGLKPRASIGISITPPDRKVLQYNQDLISRATSLGVSIQIDKFGGEAINASVFKPEGQHGVETASADYRTTFDEFELDIGMDHELDPNDGARKLGLNTGLSTSFVLAGGSLALANPSGNAFALLIPSRSLESGRIEVRANTGPVISRAGGRPILVSGLRPYFPFVASIDLPDAPPDSRIIPQAIRIVPSYRSVTVVKIREAAATTVRGRALDRNGAPLREMVGDRYQPDGTMIPFSGTFTDEEGFFECYGLEPGAQEIRWSDGSVVRFAIDQEEDRSIIELGELRTELSDAGEGGTL